MKEQLNLAILKFKTRNLFSCLIDLEKVKQKAKLLGLKDIQVVSNLQKNFNSDRGENPTKTIENNQKYIFF